MDFIRFISAWWASLSLTVKRALVLTGLLVAGLAIWVNRHGPTTEMVPILTQHELNARELSHLQLIFGQEGLNDFEIEGQTVLVPRARRDVYLKAISEHGGVALGLDAEPAAASFNPFLTARQQTQIQVEQKKQRLRQLLMRLPQIDEAWVEYDETRGERAFQPMIRTAAVTLRPAADQHLTSSLIETIRAQVRGAFPGLSDADIELIDLTHGITYRGDRPLTPEEMRDRRMRQHQTKYFNRVSEGLSGYPELRITVTADAPPFDATHLVPSQIASHPARPSQPDRPGDMPGALPGDMPGALPGDLPRNGKTAPVRAGSNGQITLASASSGGASILRANELAIESARREQWVPRINVLVGVPESSVRRLIERQTHKDRSEPDWQTVRDRFSDLQQQLKESIIALLPEEQQGRVVVSLQPEPADWSDQSESPLAVTQWFELNWQWIVLVVFILCALLIFRPRQQQRHDT